MMIIEKFIDCTVIAKEESSQSMGFDGTNSFYETEGNWQTRCDVSIRDT